MQIKTIKTKKGLRTNLRHDYLKHQEGRCAICGDTPVRPVLDHDHRTGGYRGVLCSRCNSGLGLFCDSPELLRNAIRYLKIPRIVRFPRRRTRDEVGRGYQYCLGYLYINHIPRKLPVRRV